MPEPDSTAAIPQRSPKRQARPANVVILPPAPDPTKAIIPFELLQSFAMLAILRNEKRTYKRILRENRDQIDRTSAAIREGLKKLLVRYGFAKSEGDHVN